jgi:hypothetical protein
MFEEEEIIIDKNLKNINKNKLILINFNKDYIKIIKNYLNNENKIKDKNFKNNLKEEILNLIIKYFPSLINNINSIKLKFDINNINLNKLLKNLSLIEFKFNNNKELSKILLILSIIIEIP